MKCWFLRRQENWSTWERSSRCRVENQLTQPTFDAECGNLTRATLVAGKCSCHCDIPATLNLRGVVYTFSIYGCAKFVTGSVDFFLACTVLFSHFRPCDVTLENSFLQMLSYARGYVHIT